MCLATRHGTPVGVGGRRHPLDATVGQVGDVVEGRHVDAAGAREPQQHLVASAGTPGGLPLPHDVGDREHRLLAVADDRGVDEGGDRLGVEGGVAPRDDDGVLEAPIGGMQRDAGEVEGVQHVGVAELGREGQPEEVEVAHRAVAVDGELRQAALPQLCLHVGPHGIRALGEGVLTLVDDLVEDHDALVGHADLVGVGIHQRPAGGQLLAGGSVPADVPVLDRGVQLAADVLDGLVDPFQQRLEIGPQGFTRHPSMLRGAAAHHRNADLRRMPWGRRPGSRRLGWGHPSTYIASISERCFSVTARRRSFMLGVRSPSSMVRSLSRMVNFLIVSQRLSPALSVST